MKWNLTKIHISIRKMCRPSKTLFSIQKGCSYLIGDHLIQMFYLGIQRKTWKWSGLKFWFEVLIEIAIDFNCTQRIHCNKIFHLQFKFHPLNPSALIPHHSTKMNFRIDILFRKYFHGKMKDYLGSFTNNRRNKIQISSSMWPQRYHG